ncbi:MAG: hypothetical protein H5U25_03230, partial [Oceanibaculum nanhaiense]|nr:hypothetical protein [Oceanibaculum nanhaiense]
DNETPDVEALKGQFMPLVDQGLFKARTVLVTGDLVLVGYDGFQGVA